MCVVEGPLAKHLDDGLARFKDGRMDDIRQVDVWPIRKRKTIDTDPLLGSNDDATMARVWADDDSQLHRKKKGVGARTKKIRDDAAKKNETRVPGRPDFQGIIAPKMWSAHCASICQIHGQDVVGWW